MISITVSLTIGVLTVMFLFKHSQRKEFKNGFSRKFRSGIFPRRRFIDLKVNSYHIGGVDKHFIYLGNITTPLFLTKFALDLGNQSQISLAAAARLKKTAFKYSPSASIFFAGQNSVCLPQVWLPQYLRVQTALPDSLNFDYCIAISASTYLLKTYSTELGQNVLERIQVGKQNMTQRMVPLVKQVDGIFCTDGSVAYHSPKSLLFYMYYYRNEFICADTSLNIIYKANTIDTISRAQISIAKVDLPTGERLTTFSAPPRQVNSKISVWDNSIYIVSPKMADNEDQAIFNRSTVMDVYAIENGKYKYSFYVPDLNKKKLKDFRVINGLLIGLYGNFLAVDKVQP